MNAHLLTEYIIINISIQVEVQLPLEGSRCGKEFEDGWEVGKRGS